VGLYRDGVGGVNGLDGTNFVSVSPDGARAYATGYCDSKVVVFKRDAGTGSLTFANLHGDGTYGVDGIANAAGVAPSPDGANVYVTGDGDNAVAAFKVTPLPEPATGMMLLSGVGFLLVASRRRCQRKRRSVGAGSGCALPCCYLA
jgi:DNA-binding beta-propeller fold protein YncE